MKRIWNAFIYSLQGIASAWRDEPAFRQEVILAVVMIPAAFYLAPDKISLILMIGSVLLVLALELLNTAIEATVNHISTEWAALAKKAKDTASAAVLVGLINVGLVWAIILLP
ncbi:MAG: diacylglycerol kinase [Alphaproteobacteria bacterium CG11_big_fil_rev_8_21_14_0_20_44_7]|nr:MAG: diacylglycerol kinase [Alphaproteobacteria bacterium CG11_big_fil_rev_8_21_14_0_20_44_7]